mgnify:CR=1 FL=1
MATKRGFNRAIYISGKNKETTYNTAAVGTVQLVRVSSEPFNLDIELVNDTDLSGGKEEATTLDELVRSVSGSLTFPRCTPHALAIAGKYGLGATAAAVNSDTTAYKHQFTPVAAFEMPSFSMEELVYSGLQYQYPGCMINSFELATQRKGWWTLNMDVIGSGTRNTGTASGTELSETFFKAGHVKFWRSTGAYDGATQQSQVTSDLGATLTDITTKAVNFRWRYSNNIAADDLYEFNSGNVRGRAERDRRTQDLSFSVELDDTSYLDALTAQTLWSMELDVVTTALAGAATVYYGFNLIFPQIKLKVVHTTGGVGKLLMDCETEVFQDATYGSVVLDVYNKQTSYTA